MRALDRELDLVREPELEDEKVKGEALRIGECR